jgi:hypothetical protein
MTLEDRVDALERRVARYRGATMTMALVGKAMKNGLTTLIALAALLSAPSVFAEGW